MSKLITFYTYAQAAMEAYNKAKQPELHPLMIGIDNAMDKIHNKSYALGAAMNVIHQEIKQFNPTFRFMSESVELLIEGQPTGIMLTQDSDGDTSVSIISR